LGGGGVITRSTTSLTQLCYSTANGVTQFRYLLLTVFPLKSLCTQRLLPVINGFLNVRWQSKFKTDGTVVPATDTSNLSLSPLYQQCPATLLTNNMASKKNQIFIKSAAKT